MRYIETIDELTALYGQPKPTALRKVADRIVPVYRDWIAASRFCILSTVGPEGTDASPRGDDGPVIRVLDERTLALPDWRGNDRIDSLRNILRDGRVSLMFLVPGSQNVIRVNGQARLTEDLSETFGKDGRHPRTVIVVAVEEIYFQCARAIRRAAIWSGQDESGSLPTPGLILAAMTQGEVGGESYDRDWPARADASLW